MTLQPPPPVKAFWVIGGIVGALFLLWLALKLVHLVGEADRGLGF